MVIKISKMIHFLYISWWQQNINPILGKVFKYIWKILFRSFKNFYRLLGSELPLAGCQPLKIQDFFCWLSNVCDISTLNTSRTESPKTKSYYFLKKVNKIFQVYLNIFCKLWQKIPKMSNFGHLGDHKSYEWTW